MEVNPYLLFWRQNSSDWLTEATVLAKMQTAPHELTLGGAMWTLEPWLVMTPDWSSLTDILANWKLLRHMTYDWMSGMKAVCDLLLWSHHHGLGSEWLFGCAWMLYC